jgi:hypothetical protein
LPDSLPRIEPRHLLLVDRNQTVLDLVTVSLFVLANGQEPFGGVGKVCGVAIEVVRRRQRRCVARPLKLDVESRGAKPALVMR